MTFLYLGRRGSLGQFTRELIAAADRDSARVSRFIVSDDGPVGGKDQDTDAVFSVPTFSRATPVSVARNYFAARRMILDRLQQDRPDAVVALMPHVWTPLLAPAIKGLGIRYAPIIHDARPHPGDSTAWTTRWLLRDAKHGDSVITLSQNVADKLVEQRKATRERTVPLFHPDLAFQNTLKQRVRDRTRPLRVLFFGRVMSYKGLAHLTDAIEILHGQGMDIELGLAGSGDLGKERARLEALGAEIINRWIDESEVSGILDRYDVMASPHVEASQSGVVATALGHGMPVVAMPTGGITEQIVDSETGILTKDITAMALAEAINRLATEPDLYDTISSHIVARADDRSMTRFLEEIYASVLAT
ncbi:glycosyltransferase family 4 protein [Methyloceanibacter sp. wino2]|uniref:glycosyltransferase family 4 protein n=1 Tax=Methyloceanibacter sp. wino2 TaxID=2170729 RepID=UPI00131F36D7|nr:glycosyltransferase family 4 protein [Methyloceanibacter sp. wino2]